MHGRVAPHPTDPDSTPEERASWAPLILLCVAQFMVILDVTVVNVALPSIRAGLGFAAADLQWIVIAYVLMTGGLLLLGGRVADLAGRRTVFVVGLAVFTLASLACGASASPGMLIAARALQGLGAALLSPAALSLVTVTYTGQQRAIALAAWGAIGGAGAAVGVFLGGALTTWLGWRWVFFINVPVGLATIAAVPHLLARDERSATVLSDLDIPGAVALVGGLATLVYGVEGASTSGWASVRTLVPAAAAIVLLTAFIVLERRASRPLIAPATWRRRSLVSSAAVMLGATGILIGTFFLNSLLLQNVLGDSALQTGAAFLPLVLVLGLAAHIGPQLLGRFGARMVAAGALGLVAAGELWLTGAGLNASYARDLLPGFVLLGLGIGLTFVAVSVTAMSEIDDQHAGLASGLMTTAHELGGALGVALFSTVAIGAGPPAGAAFVNGYADGTLVGALLAAGLAVLAMLAMPAAKPSSLSTRVAFH